MYALRKTVRLNLLYLYFFLNRMGCRFQRAFVLSEAPHQLQKLPQRATLMVFDATVVEIKRKSIQFYPGLVLLFIL